MLITVIYLLKYFKKQNFINFENWCSIEGWGGGIGTLYGPFLSVFLLPLTTLVSSPNQTLVPAVYLQGPLRKQKTQKRKQHVLQISRQIYKCNSLNHINS